MVYVHCGATTPICARCDDTTEEDREEGLKARWYMYRGCREREVLGKPACDGVWYRETFSEARGVKIDAEDGIMYA